MSYTIFPAVLKKENAAVSTSSASVSFGKTSELMKEAVLIEQNWLEHAVKVMAAQDVIDREDSVTWAAYHASRCDADNYCPTFTQLMPLFDEKAASASMVKHKMTVQMKATQHQVIFP